MHKNIDPPKQKIRPLVRVSPGVWHSRDGRWTFLRHWSDPAPQRWLAYHDKEKEPENAGGGHTTLWEVVKWAETWEPDFSPPAPSSTEQKGSELVTAAQDALVAMAAWKITDQQRNYLEIGDDLRKAFYDAHDKLLNALGYERNTICE